MNHILRSESCFKESSFKISSEHFSSASFSQDGDKFFAVSWKQLWIGTVQLDQWKLKPGGIHYLVCVFTKAVGGISAYWHQSVTNNVPFEPYLIPFSTREALFAHNPPEDRLMYLEKGSSTKVNLGGDVTRVCLSEAEDTLIYVRKRRRTKMISVESYYGLSWRSIIQFPVGAVSFGEESGNVDLDIAVEDDKKFSITTSVEQGKIIAWVATAKGEIRKCRLV
jgi:hypothetical protein